MIGLDVVREIERLLAAGNVTHREIQRRTRVSRATIKRIANGTHVSRRRKAKRDDRDEPTKLRPSQESIPRRCPECGGLVYMPCLLCDARLFREKRGVSGRGGESERNPNRDSFTRRHSPQETRPVRRR